MANAKKPGKPVPLKICKKGKVEFNVNIVVDRNAIVKDCEGGRDHDIQVKCFRKHPDEEGYNLKITPLDNILKIPEPERREVLKRHVNARALLSVLLALADADFEAALLKLRVI